MDDDASSVGDAEISSGFRRHLNRQLGIDDVNIDSPTTHPNASADQSSQYIAEIQRLRDALTTTATGPVEAKYLEQLKRNRELVVKLESERSRVAKLTARIVAIEKERLEAQELESQQKHVGLPSQKAPAATTASSRIGVMEVVEEPLEERLDKALKSIALQRKLIDDQKRENLRMRRVLQLELGGDEDFVEQALKTVQSEEVAAASAVKGGGWKGRAQQIALLKGKLKDAERRMQRIQESADGAEGSAIDVQSSVDHCETATQRTTTMTVRSGATTARDFDDVNRSVVEVKQKKLQIQAREMQQRLDARERDVEEERRRSESFQARLQILERDNQHLKTCLQRIVEKTENDDRLIEAYKSELEEKRQEIRRVNTAGAGSSRRSLPQDTQMVETLQREVARLEDTIAELRRRGSRDETRAWQSPSDNDPDALLHFIEEQRRTILALESQLQKRDRTTSSQFESVKGCDAVLREENAALKYRVRAITEMMEKEIALHDALAAQKAVAAATARDAVGAALHDFGPDGSVSSLPPIVSRPTSTTSNASRRSSGPAMASKKSEKTVAAPPSSLAATNSAVRQEDFDQLKKQYDELKRAFNAQQSRSMK